MYLNSWRNDAPLPAWPATRSMHYLHHLMPASMASYLPIHCGESTDTEADDDSKQSFLHDERGTPVESLVLIRSRWLEWIKLSISVVATICASWGYMTSAGITRPRDTRGLLKPNQYPGVDEFAVDLAHAAVSVQVIPARRLRASRSCHVANQVA
ncbi:uncharacterized protein LAESUDRAFT_711652 [Laetiporus sulphureus 93-53]|uniref:Uncharacterized protein n=1 Tax=Laetiporus sulphureus 93-53 TaxID=1314785 RepID=A0A165GKS9_9APHY|nr:uncharacterized protein LAESUDRAFT_711652 [Laetiporus sulphureus 93-53]KZT10488.1 hypothetical protein LAESUDRAFT_711652 [Laetiporus sulphureus 93-53]